MTLDVIQPGLATSIQDEGRAGHYSLGFPEGGAMDRESARLGNALVGNPADCAVLECTYVGPVLVATTGATIAVTGAPADVRVNGELREQWTRIELEPGDELSFGMIRGGTRYYVAVRGGIDVPRALGSRSTYAIGSIGGVGGRALRAGDRLPVGSPTAPLPRGSSIHESARPLFAKEQEIRVMLGLYHHLLTAEGARRLVEEEWILTPTADRMGLRYDGPGVGWRDRPQPFGAGQDPSNIVDAGYAVGSIQIPGGTQPIVLHRDAVSGGGYATVGTVITADMDVLARAAPGTLTRFLPVTMEQALGERRARRDRLQEVVRSLMD
ncbi:biotin-dependent carboxyltransferase family protein [Leifsonia sp. WHRI 6310E]|uniref:5-oxoprolinase subunit C family protein n=1 Tax=Leifsonia sp. WHRI 6310E TaxID=3162562 RepID=UPI0032ECB941